VLKVDIMYLQHNNIRGVRLSGGVGPPFHPSVSSSVHPSSSSRKKKMMEESTIYKEMGASCPHGLEAEIIH
jgi:hypothetical protein